MYMKNYIAHIREDGTEQTLKEHLQNVAKMAEEFAGGKEWKEWAYLAGMLHDIGKYSTAFQEYIRCSADCEETDENEEEKPATIRKVEHAITGAVWSQKETLGKIFSYLIAGHHTGLTDWSGSQKALEFKLQNPRQPDQISEAIHTAKMQNILNVVLPKKLPPGIKKENFALWIRMLFSCLKDADCLDTEAFMDSEKYTARAHYPTLSELKLKFDGYMKKKTGNVLQTKVNQLRGKVLDQCRKAAVLPQGIFSLTVPTGGGKTLSGTAFALSHALQHRKKRLIYVIPYTSIIEQTADVFREIFGENNVVEHHSNLDPEKDSYKNQLAAENWDAPIIITTNVQFFESLFSAKTSRCRKLHNTMDSVVILDEVQLLPTDFLEPILNVIKELNRFFGVSFLLSTATQPALNKSKVIKNGLEPVTEIIDDPLVLHEALKRVEYHLPANFQTPQTWEELTEELFEHKTVLCVVNSRRHAYELYNKMPEGTLHLSALMCGKHRSKVIGDIKRMLADKEPVRVISTQLVEAGVDIDFPVVYRALAGLDSIAQAAGRCNREGKLKKGEVFIFVPPENAPRGVLRKAEDKSRELFMAEIIDLTVPGIFTRFFELYYSAVNSLDKNEIKSLLEDGAKEIQIQFRAAAEKFQLIDDKASFSIFVRYQNNDALLNQLKYAGPVREIMRKLQRYTVQVPRNTGMMLLSKGIIEEIYEGFFALTSELYYSENTGLKVFDEKVNPDNLVF